MNALDYFLKANLYGLLFAGCYWLLLRRHTFFSINRAYLLLSAVLSLLLPLVSFPTQTVETLPNLDWPVPVGVIALPVTTLAVQPIETLPTNPATDWEQMGLMIYGLIALILLMRVLIRVGRLVWLIRRSPRQAGDDYVLVQPNDPGIPTFSFFGYMVLNPADSHNKLITDHEVVHIRQYHSVDVVGMSLLRAVFWACPTLWLLDRLLRQVHEFLADKQTNQPTDYARFLIEYTFGVRPDTLTNGFFNPSLLKQRILMLRQRATTRWALGKYVLVIPLAMALLAMTTAREEMAAVVNQSTDETITISGRVTSAVDGKPLPGAIVMIASTGKGSPTDVQGRYKLQNVPKSALLSISFVGFTTMVVPVSTGRTVVNAALSPTAPNELPTMGATAVYKAIKPNLAMPVRTPPSSETINGQVYDAVEEPAVFPTGIPGLMQYVAHTLHYPAKAQAAGVQGNVFVQFIVLPTGAIGSAKVKKGIGSGCDEEALRIVRQMPRWIPGKQNGKTVAMQYVLPIQFALEKREDKRTGQIVTPQPDSSTKTESVLDNGKNARFALSNDFKGKVFARSDSNPTVQPDFGKKLNLKLHTFPFQRSGQNSQMRYSRPPVGGHRITSPGRGLPGEKAELFLLNGTKQIDRIEDVNRNDIESIEVHKGEEMIAKYKILYGEKASKGVVIIHLKSANTL